MTIMRRALEVPDVAKIKTVEMFKYWATVATRAAKAVEVAASTERAAGSVKTVMAATLAIAKWVVILR